MASMTIRKKWYEKLQQISDNETRNDALWAIIEYLATGSECVVNRFREVGNECMSLMTMVIDDVEKSRLRAEAARKRREERKRNEQNGYNRPRCSKQHIYEQYPAMFIFDGFASYLMSTAFTAGRKVITGKFGEIDFDKAISMFRELTLARKQLGNVQRFSIFREMFTRFVNEHQRVLTTGCVNIA